MIAANIRGDASFVDYNSCGPAFGHARGLRLTSTCPNKREYLPTGRVLKRDWWNFAFDNQPRRAMIGVNPAVCRRWRAAADEMRHLVEPRKKGRFRRDQRDILHLVWLWNRCAATRSNARRSWFLNYAMYRDSKGFQAGWLVRLTWLNSEIRSNIFIKSSKEHCLSYAWASKTANLVNPLK